jgi:hypothetical protein
MQSHSEWQNWAETLHRLKLGGFVSWLLEAGSHLHLFGAQAIYVSQPFVGRKQMGAIAQMLENEDETRAFAQFLRDEEQQ